MADSVTVKARMQYAVNGDISTLPLAVDYGSALDFVSATPTRRKMVSESVPTGGTTFSMADFTTVVQFAVWNEDTTNYVTVTWTSAGASNSQKVPAGQCLLAPQADIANVVLTANTAACKCSLIVFGT